MKKAMQFRLSQRTQGNLISYVDCIGYMVAVSNTVAFLTGEKHFKDLPDVLFTR